MCRPCVGHEVANECKISKVAQGHDGFQSSGGPEVVGSVGTIDIKREKVLQVPEVEVSQEVLSPECPLTSPPSQGHFIPKWHGHLTWSHERKLKKNFTMLSFFLLPIII